MSETSESAPSRWMIYLSILILGPLTYLAHEFGHWAAGEAIGVEMWMSLNKAGPVDAYNTQLQQIIVALAGPAVTIALAIAATFFLKGPFRYAAYGIVFFQFMLRFVAGGVTMMSDHPNDEAAAGILLGVGPYVITFAVAAFLFFLTWRAARIVRPGWLHNVGAYILTSAVITVFVFSDQFLRNSDFILLGSRG